MLHKRLQRPFAHLALLAMLALALLPSAGRIASALRTHDTIDDFGLAALCSPSGLGAASPVFERAARLQAGVDPAAPAPGKPSPHDGDCAYCPLLGGIALPMPHVLAALPSLAADATPSPTWVARPLERLPGAHGPRGPPA